MNSDCLRVGFKCFLSVCFPSEPGNDLFSMILAIFHTLVVLFFAESSRIPGHNFACFMICFVVLGRFSSVLSSFSMFVRHSTVILVGFNSFLYALCSGFVALRVGFK